MSLSHLGWAVTLNPSRRAVALNPRGTEPVDLFDGKKGHYDFLPQQFVPHSLSLRVLILESSYIDRILSSLAINSMSSNVHLNEKRASHIKCLACGYEAYYDEIWCQIENDLM